MEGGPWQANGHSLGQGIPYLSQNLKVYYRVHNILQLVPILSQMNPVLAILFL
jgi:hypothetical protein